MLLLVCLIGSCCCLPLWVVWCACMCVCQGVTRVLLKFGANVHLRDSQQRTALITASARNHSLSRPTHTSRRRSSYCVCVCVCVCVLTVCVCVCTCVLFVFLFQEIATIAARPLLVNFFLNYTNQFSLWLFSAYYLSVCLYLALTCKLCREQGRSKRSRRKRVFSADGRS